MRTSMLLASLTSLLAVPAALGLSVPRASSVRFTFSNAPAVGACDSVYKDSDNVVALSPAQFGQGENCGKTITIEYNGHTEQATVLDLCPSCGTDGVDLTTSLFQKFQPLNAGLFVGSWSYV